MMEIGKWDICRNITVSPLFHFSSPFHCLYLSSFTALQLPMICHYPPLKLGLIRQFQETKINLYGVHSIKVHNCMYVHPLMSVLIEYVLYRFM